MNVEKAIRNLELRGFGVKHFASAQEAADYLTGAIKNCSVGIGGSQTIDALGIYDTLKESCEVYWHWKTPGVQAQAASTDVYLSSANAISEDGEIPLCTARATSPLCRTAAASLTRTRPAR